MKDIIVPSNSVTAFIVSTYGEGEPTDNAKNFFQELNKNEKTIDCNYSVFGLGNSQCFKDRYNVIGKALDQRLDSLGGKRLLPIGLGDASNNNSAAFYAWKKDFLNILNEMKIDNSSHINNPTSVTPVEQNTPLETNIAKKTDR